MTGLHPTELRRMAWAGPGLMIAFGLGLWPIAGFIPPPEPSAQAAEVVRIYEDDADGIRIACFVMLSGLVLLVPWGVALAECLRRIPSVSPALISAQLVSLSVATTLVLITPLTWGVAAFRAGEVGPDVTQTLNDLGWFFLVFTFAPFSLWCVLLALAIFADPSPRPIFPRWAAYLCIWNALQLVPAGLIVFFKTGPFAWDGVMALYIPLVVFFAWMLGLTIALFRATATPSATEPSVASAVV